MICLMKPKIWEILLSSNSPGSDRRLFSGPPNAKTQNRTFSVFLPSLESGNFVHRGATFAPERMRLPHRSAPSRSTRPASPADGQGRAYCPTGSGTTRSCWAGASSAVWRILVVPLRRRVNYSSNPNETPSRKRGRNHKLFSRNRTKSCKKCST